MKTRFLAVNPNLGYYSGEQCYGILTLGLNMPMFLINTNDLTKQVITYEELLKIDRRVVINSFYTGNSVAFSPFFQVVPSEDIEFDKATVRFDLDKIYLNGTEIGLAHVGKSLYVKRREQLGRELRTEIVSLENIDWESSLCFAYRDKDELVLCYRLHYHVFKDAKATGLDLIYDLKDGEYKGYFCWRCYEDLVFKRKDLWYREHSKEILRWSFNTSKANAF